MQRKIGVSWNAYGKLPIEEEVSLFLENGFDATFAMADHRDLPAIIPALRAAGIACETFHAPFKKINDIWKPGEDGDAMAERLFSSVRACARYEVPALIVHLSSGLTPPRVCDEGHARFAALTELADREGVTLCYENQRMLSNIAYAFETFPSAKFCWDVGHEACFTPGRKYMPLFGGKLAALHIHDNAGVFNGDDHMIPFDAKIDFPAAMREISAVGFRGTLMLEIIRHNTGFYDAMTPQEYYRRAADAARRLVALADAFDEELAAKGENA